jgi:hypothetical protein
MKKNIFKNLISKNKNQKGVVVLFAVLVAVLLVSIAATIISIAIRQTVLSSTGRESQYAFYAANTALECALYWDLNPPEPLNSGDPLRYVFPATFDPLNQEMIKETEETYVTCSNYSFMVDGDFTPDNSSAGEDTYEFQIIISSDITDDDYCAKATVNKRYKG